MNLSEQKSIIISYLKDNYGYVPCLDASNVDDGWTLQYRCINGFGFIIETYIYDKPASIIINNNNKTVLWRMDFPEDDEICLKTICCFCDVIISELKKNIIDNIEE